MILLVYYALPTEYLQGGIGWWVNIGKEFQLMLIKTIA